MPNRSLTGRSACPRRLSLPIALGAVLAACADPSAGLESADAEVRAASGSSRLEPDAAPVMAAALQHTADPVRDAEAPAAVPAVDEPISAPLETWTWVSFPDAVCADGSPTGIGVNLTDRSDRVLIFFEGGGGCWDYATCYQLGFAANLGGYGQQEFTNRKPYNNLALLQRDNALNPLADASMIYIPYCTGDVHTGDRVTDLSGAGQTVPTHFVGYQNVASYLRRIVPTFPDASRVWLSGWSAGGFGAAFNWDQAQTAFGSIRVDVIDDSGPPVMPQQARWDTWVEAWNLQFPADCADCTTGPDAVIEYLGNKYGDDHRLGLLSYTEDSTIATYFNITRKRFKLELNRMATTEFDTRANVKYFFVEGSSHTLLGSNTAGPDGTRLYDWLDAMVNDDPAWTSTRP